jgi:hypothetical protein
MSQVVEKRVRFHGNDPGGSGATRTITSTEPPRQRSAPAHVG